MASDFKESELYECVKKWAENKTGLHCQQVWKNKGLEEARPDVTGLRHVGGNLCSDFELITIEVKKDDSQFLTSAGQARAYSVYADRTYLCCYLAGGSFDEEQIEFASHLGIGLIAIDESRKPSSELTAPLCHPIPRKRLELVESLGVVTCQICGIPFPRSGDVNVRNSWAGLTRESWRTAISKAVKENNGYMWWLTRWAESHGRNKESTYDRRFICPDCVFALFWESAYPNDDGN